MEHHHLSSGLKLALLLTLLSGCAAQRTEQARRAPGELTGLTKPELLHCAGQPARVEKTPGGERLVYAGRTPDYACPAQKLVSGPSPQRECQATFTLSGGRVTALDYANPAGGPFTLSDQCAFLVERCLGERP